MDDTSVTESCMSGEEIIFVMLLPCEAELCLLPEQVRDVGEDI